MGRRFRVRLVIEGILETNQTLLNNPWNRNLWNQSDADNIPFRVENLQNVHVDDIEDVKEMTCGGITPETMFEAAIEAMEYLVSSPEKREAAEIWLRSIYYDDCSKSIDEIQRDIDRGRS